MEKDQDLKELREADEEEILERITKSPLTKFQGPHNSPINLKALENLYSDLNKTESCKHINSKVFQDENYVYHFKCSDCGRTAMGDLKAAITLGWINLCQK